MATNKVKTEQSAYKQAAEITRLVAFLALGNTDRQAMALDYFTNDWEGKSLQRHVLALAPATIKEVAQAVEDYLATQSNAS